MAEDARMKRLPKSQEDCRSAASKRRGRDLCSRDKHSYPKRDDDIQWLGSHRPYPFARTGEMRSQTKKMLRAMKEGIRG